MVDGRWGAGFLVKGADTLLPLSVHFPVFMNRLCAISNFLGTHSTVFEWARSAHYCTIFREEGVSPRSHPATVVGQAPAKGLVESPKKRGVWRGGSYVFARRHLEGGG